MRKSTCTELIVSRFVRNRCLYMSENMSRSAGFLLKSRNKYFVGHTTQRKDDKQIRQFDGNWTIIKGMVDNDEDFWAAALRELKEESSIDLEKDFPSLIPIEKTVFTTYTTGKKNVYVFLIDDTEGLLIDSNINYECTSLLVDMPDKFKHREGAPEIDSFLWVSREDAKRMVFKSQQCLFE